jgi:hypothetical protein
MNNDGCDSWENSRFDVYIELLKASLALKRLVLDLRNL